MFLKKLEIQGFKSFYEKVDLAFPGSVTAVVGPNGCGKSNICDAVAWALGEQSAKILRGERMDDDAYLVAPTLFEGVADDAYLSCEEVFGPVTSLYKVSDLDEALRRANAVRFYVRSRWVCLEESARALPDWPINGPPTVSNRFER